MELVSAPIQVSAVWQLQHAWIAGVANERQRIDPGFDCNRYGISSGF